MDLRRRFCKCEDWHLHRANLFLLVLTLGLFIGIDILDRGFKIDVWTNIPYSFLTISNFIKSISDIVQLVLTYLLVLIIVWATALAFNTKLNSKQYVEMP
jgi:hypothetical protein